MKKIGWIKKTLSLALSLSVVQIGPAMAILDPKGGGQTIQLGSTELPGGGQVSTSMVTPGTDGKTGTNSHSVTTTGPATTDKYGYFESQTSVTETTSQKYSTVDGTILDTRHETQTVTSSGDGTGGQLTDTINSQFTSTDDLGNVTNGNSFTQANNGAGYTNGGTGHSSSVTNLATGGTQTRESTSNLVRTAFNPLSEAFTHSNMQSVTPQENKPGAFSVQNSWEDSYTEYTRENGIAKHGPKVSQGQSVSMDVAEDGTFNPSTFRLTNSTRNERFEGKAYIGNGGVNEDASGMGAYYALTSGGNYNWAFQFRR